MSTILAVDVGGSGLRARRIERARDDESCDPGELFESDGAAITGDGIDLESLLAPVAAFDSRQGARPDVVVWSMRGLLGLSDPEHVLRQVHSRLGARSTVVASDAVTSLIGALGEVRPGAVLAAGSGAVAFATDFADIWRLVDGWGHVLADRGSGAWIGLEGLRAALATEDHVPGGSILLHEAAISAWGAPRTWPRLVMTTPDAQARLAAFAPVVASLTDADPVAAGIVQQAAVHLADSLESAASSLAPGSSVSGASGTALSDAGLSDAGLSDAGLSEPRALVTAVGGLLQSTEVSAAFGAEARRRGLDLTVACGTALDGALTLGRHVGEGRALAARPPYLLLSWHPGPAPTPSTPLDLSGRG